MKSPMRTAGLAAGTLRVSPQALREGLIACTCTQKRAPVLFAWTLAEVVRINAERIQILTMLQEGKISVPEAERLLEAISTGRQREEERILRLRITEQGRVMANVRIPLGWLKA